MKIFVYGTLRRGEINHKFLKQIGANYLGEAETEQRFSSTFSSKGVPRLYRGRKPSSLDKQVQGELYDVSDDKIKTIDRLEGHPLWYKRELIWVRLPSGTHIQAWAYLFRWGWR